MTVGKKTSAGVTHALVAGVGVLGLALLAAMIWVPLRTHLRVEVYASGGGAYVRTALEQAILAAVEGNPCRDAGRDAEVRERAPTAPPVCAFDAYGEHRVLACGLLGRCVTWTSVAP